MPKRPAEGPQGDKTTLSEFHMASTPDDKPQRATAAQMANRKIREVRRRPRATTPTSGAGAPFAGAFSSLGVPPETSFSSAPSFGSNAFSSDTFAPSTQSTGFGFGQSQSFPGAFPSQPQQDGAPFAFGGGGQPGFRFSSNPPPFELNESNHFYNPNPFGMHISFTNGHSGNQPTSTGRSPFNAPSFQTSQQAFSSGQLGTQQALSAPTSTGVFGRPATTGTAADSMETSPDAKPKASAFTSAPGRNLFSSAGTPSLAPSQPSNLFRNLGVPSTGDKAQPAEAQPFKAFGTEPEKTQATQPTSSNIFAPKPATSQPASSLASNNLFAPKAATEQTAPGPSNIFAPKAASDQAALNPFTSQPAAEQAPAKPAETQAFKPLFGTTPSTSAPSTQPSNLFASTPAAEARPFGSLFENTPSTLQATEPGQAAQTATSNIFTAKTSAEPSAAKPAETQPFSSFGGTSKPQTSESEKATHPASGIFAPKPTADQTSARPAEAQPFAPSFGGTPSTAAVQPSQPAPSNLFTAAPANPFQTQPSGPLEAKTSTAGPSALEQPQATLSAPNNIFAPKPAAEAAATQPTPTPTQPSGDLSAVPESARSGVSNMAYTRPDELPKPQMSSNEKAKLSDDAFLVAKLRTFNRAFKAELMKRNPDTEDFDELIVFYLKARKGLGLPIPIPGAPKEGDTILTATSQGESTLLSSQGESESASEDDSATANAFAHSYSTRKPDLGNQTASASSQPPTSPAPTQPANLANNMFANRNSAANASATSTPAEAGPSRPSVSQSTEPPPAIPKFGNGSSGADFMAQFKKQAEESMSNEKAKRKAEEFDSDEDDEAEWERKDAERQREKRTKIEAAGKNRVAKYVPGKGFMFVDEDATPATEAGPVASASPGPSPDLGAKTGEVTKADKVNKTGTSTPSSSIFASSPQPVPSSENIFGRLGTPQLAGKHDHADSSGDEGRKRRASAEDDDEDQRQSKKVITDSDIAKSKSSLDTPVPAPTQAADRSLFERVSTPSRQEDASPQPFASHSFTSSSVNTPTPFGASQTAPTDHTWKPNSPIKFAADSAPATSSENATPAENSDEPDGEPGAIFDLTRSNAGEEGEEVVHESRARAYKLVDGKWSSMGTGVIRLLRNPVTHGARMVLRADPGGNIILNTLLKSELDYVKARDSVQFMVPTSQTAEQWAIRFKSAVVDTMYNKIMEIKN